MQKFDICTRKTDKVLENVGGFVISSNGEKALYEQLPPRNPLCAARWTDAWNMDHQAGGGARETCGAGANPTELCILKHEGERRSARGMEADVP